ncbi:MAG TPA: protein kinase [Candidatus Acidoferrales bacterium]|nr:protein kinase [Candidatus Acidoferrales bacterium]
MPAGEFEGTERYLIQRRLGRGGYGVVYEAYDRRQNTLVALKTLHRAGADALYRFKREFRALADIHHPNLVALYDLVSEGEHWFFTMELLAGVDFLTWVMRPPPRSAESPGVGSPYPESQPTVPLSETKTTTTPQVDSPGAVTGQAEPSIGPRTPRTLDQSRLRTAARQLAEGIAELHRAGTLHRDLKPSNVLVTPQGRVVILDFGLIAEMSVEGSTSGNPLAGTPAYMAPEQAEGQPAADAADWYAFGVMLFEALTGRRPFDGSAAEVIARKQRSDAPSPSSLATGIPPDLEALCVDLLQREAAKRPGGAEVLRRLGAAAHLGPAPAKRIGFVGRERELGALHEALERTREGAAAVVLLHGASGIGKSALVNHFLDGIRRRAEVLPLAGRCLERESVPYRAFDSVIDLLSRYLKRLPASELDRVLPHDMPALARLFPALREVAVALSPLTKAAGVADPKELRQRAFGALRDMFWRLGRRTVPVVFIDDAQWGDADSAALLSQLILPPASPRLLLIASYRREEAGAGPLVQTLVTSAAAPGPNVHVVEIPLEGLSSEESRQLATAMYGGEGGLAVARAQDIARDSAGNPLFVSELVRAPEAAGALSLDEVIQARVSRLNEPARRLLDVVAVAGRPIALDLAKRAARHQGPDYDVLAALRGGRLVRLRAAGDTPEIEAYHDRIREAVSAQLTPQDFVNCHASLATVLEASARPEPEALAMHFHGAGDNRKAARYAAAAAGHAAEALAFERAARLYRFALDLETEDPAKQRELRASLGDALGNSGRGAEAAEAYLAAAAASVDTGALEYRRRAAAQLLMSGHLEQGIGVLRDVLAASGMRLARSPWRALLSLLLRRVWIRIRGLGFVEREARSIPVRDLVGVDTCWSVAQGLGVVDTIRAADFQARHLLLALRAGDPYRVSRALAVEAGYHALSGGRQRLHTQSLLETNRALAQRIQQQQPHALGLATMVEGMAAFLEGRWSDARELHEQAETVLRERCVGVAWELATVHLMSSVALFFLGEFESLTRRLPVLLKQAEARGDLYEATDLKIRISHANWLAVDQPDAARREVKDAISRWPAGEFYVQHWWALIANVEIALYSGENEAAWGLVLEQWPLLSRSFLLRVQYIRIESLYHRAAAALAVAADTPGSPRANVLLKQAQKDARRILRERMPWSDPLGHVLHAGVVSMRGDRNRAIELVHLAESGFDRAHMRLFAAAARRRRGELLGGGPGRELAESADAWMANQKIRNSARMAAMLVPEMVLEPR